MQAPSSHDTRLVRAIGRWSLAALMFNTIIGASVFGVPSLLAARLGALSVPGYLIAAVGVGIIAACLAEVASQFREAGGPYLYARTAFGPFVAIQIGWMMWLSRIAASSAVANLFVSYGAQFYPMIQAPLPRALVLAALISFLAAVNYRGVTGGTAVSNVFTVAKLGLLAFLIAGGLAALLLHPALRVTPPAVTPSTADWFDALLLMVYAYAGFEAAFLVAGETRDPRKDAPFALLVSIATATLVFVSLQYVVIHILPNAAATTKPAADAAQRFLGPAGAWLVAGGALVSIYGYLSANMLHSPRLTFAMGEQGDFPAWFASVHPRFRTPYVSIVLFAVLVIAFSVAGSFRWNAVVSVLARIFVYGAIAAALPALRRKQPLADAFRLPAGNLFAALSLVFMGVIASRIERSAGVVLAVTLLIGFLTWAWSQRRRRGTRSQS
ncbi:MAG: APC family permease [Terriglobales bacterium]|jgi:amino acid transporter